MEVHFKYLDRVNKADDKIEQKKRVRLCMLYLRHAYISQKAVINNHSQVSLPIVYITMDICCQQPLVICGFP